MVDLPSQPLGALDPLFEQVALETAALTFGLPGTSLREKLLLNLANDVCRGHFGLAFRLHVQAAFEHGVPLADLRGAVRFLAPYAGYPAAADALDRLGAVAAALAADTLRLELAPWNVRVVIIEPAGIRTDAVAKLERDAAAALERFGPEGRALYGIANVMQPDYLALMRVVITETPRLPHLGSLLTYAIHDGLLVGDGPPRVPAPERVEVVVQLFMKLLT